jgi:hypothetical protein
MRCFWTRRVSVDLSPFTVLVGPNGAGETSVPELQIVASTHSPFLLREVAAEEEVRVLGQTEVGVRCRTLTEHPEYERRKTVPSTGEIWANLGEDWVGNGAGRADPRRHRRRRSSASRPLRMARPARRAPIRRSRLGYLHAGELGRVSGLVVSSGRDLAVLVADDADPGPRRVTVEAA